MKLDTSEARGVLVARIINTKVNHKQTAENTESLTADCFGMIIIITSFAFFLPCLLLMMTH